MTVCIIIGHQKDSQQSHKEETPEEKRGDTVNDNRGAWSISVLCWETGWKIGRGHFKGKTGRPSKDGGLKQTTTPDITYPGCRGNLNNRDRTHHNQRNRMFSMAAIPHAVELLS